MRYVYTKECLSFVFFLFFSFSLKKTLIRFKMAYKVAKKSDLKWCRGQKRVLPYKFALAMESNGTMYRCFMLCWRERCVSASSIVNEKKAQSEMNWSNDEKDYKHSWINLIQAMSQDTRTYSIILNVLYRSVCSLNLLLRLCMYIQNYIE